MGRAFYASISTAVLRACRVPACTTHRSISARRAAAAYIVAVASILFTCKLKSTTQPASVALRSWLLLLVAQPPRSLRGGASRPSCCGAICAPWATGGAGAGARSHAGGAALESPPPRVRMCVVYSEYILLLVYTGIYWYILIGPFPHTPVYTTYIPVEYLFSFNIKSPQP